jgi:hypothetical protein
MAKVTMAKQTSEANKLGATARRREWEEEVHTLQAEPGGISDSFRSTLHHVHVRVRCNEAVPSFTENSE